jgi:hypothetical protein
MNYLVYQKEQMMIVLLTTTGIAYGVKNVNFDYNTIKTLNVPAAGLSVAIT